MQQADLTTIAARPHPMRATLATYPYTCALRPRWGDMDAYGHVNNLALGAMHEELRAQFGHLSALRNEHGNALRLVVSQTVNHFLAEVHWPAEVTGAAGVGRLGNTSVVLSTALFVDGICASLCDSTMVLVGKSGPVPIPDTIRAGMLELALKGVDQG
jgi:acyl-CoA thioester hydrolase